MITGILNWENANIRYDQTENATEAIIRKINIQHGVSAGHYESCGASACCCEMEGLGYLKIADYPMTIMGGQIQMDDFLMMYLNDPRNDFEDSDRMDNRYLRSYPKVVKQLFNCESETFDTNFTRIKELIEGGHGVQVCLENPGHFIALIAYDYKKDEFIYHDSWANRVGNVYGGLYERLGWDEFSNIIGTSIVYYKK